MQTGAGSLKLSELIGSLSYALDLTEGQPEGHCVRSCWIGMRVGAMAGLNGQQLWELYYTLLLKDVGCSSNVARICELYLTDDLDDIATAFGQVVDSKSPYTGGHSARVALYTDMIGEALGLSPDRRRWLKRGALLHDVGKLGVSNSILDKPGALDRDEWAAVRRHAEFTEIILSRITAFAELGRIAGAHHERLDGGGYPRGLVADEIDLERGSSPLRIFSTRLPPSGRTAGRSRRWRRWR